MTLGLTHGWTSKRINENLIFSQTADENDFITKIYNKETKETIIHRHDRYFQREEATRLMNSNKVAIYIDRDGNEHNAKSGKFYEERDRQYYRDLKKK